MAMASDLKLDGERVRVEAWDLVLDAADRRKTQEGERRALVHDYQDGLTLNWGNDYPGGVKLYGVRHITKDPHFLTGVTISGGLHVNQGDFFFTGQRIYLKSDPENPAGVQIHGNVHFSDAVVLSDKTTVRQSVSGTARPMQYNIFEEISNLRKEVAELKKKLNA
jgi:hypothetical protein